MNAIVRERFRPRFVVRDRPAVDVPVDSWTDAENMIVTDGVPERMPGLVAEYSPLSINPIFNMPMRIRTAASPSWIYASRQNIFITDGSGTHNNITPAGGIINDVQPNGWAGTTLNRLPVMSTPGLDNGPYYYRDAGGTPFEVLPGWNGSLLGPVRAFGNFLLALGYITDTGVRLPDVVRWSNAAAAGQVPDTWIPAVDNFAGEAALSDTPGELIDGAPLGRNFLAYKDHSTYLGRITADQFVMEWRLRFSEFGCFSRNGVAAIGANQHAVFADGDVVLTDGQNVRSLLKPQWRRWLFANISSEPLAFRTSFMALDIETSQLWVFFPRGADKRPQDALLINTSDGEVTHLVFPFICDHARSGLISVPPGTPPTWATWNGTAWNALNQPWRIASLTPASDRILIASELQRALYSAKGEGPIVNPDSSSTAIVARIERETLDLGEPAVVKHVHRVWPHITGLQPGETVTVRVGTQPTADDAVSYTWLQTFDPASDRDGVPVDVQGRYISFRFETNDINRRWRIPSFDVEYSLRGRF